MPMPSKGLREKVDARVPAEVKRLLEAMQAETGVKSESQLVSDLLSMATGRPDLVLELNQEVLRFRLSA